LEKIGRVARSVLSLNRHREYTNLMRMLRLRPSDRVLDVGSGDGFWTVRFASQCARVVGLEPDEQLLGMARRLHTAPNLTYVRGVAEAMPFDSGRFDKVVSVSCLEHFRDPAAGLREMARIMKPGGRIALSVDSLLAENSPAEFREWHRERHYVTQYFRVEELLAMMRDDGVRCEPDQTVHLFRSRLASRVREMFIRRPTPWLPLFPLLYGVVLAADRTAGEMHGQIVIMTGTRGTESIGAQPRDGFPARVPSSGLSA
jgi:SAM-dependent methyltransferase